MKQLMIGIALMTLLLTGCGSSDNGTDMSAVSLTPPQPQGVSADTMPPSPPTIQ